MIQPAAINARLRTDRPPECPLCWDPVVAGEACSACDVRYHATCADALARCAVLGCPGRLGERASKRSARGTPKRQRGRLVGLVGVGAVAALALLALERAGLVERKRDAHSLEAIGGSATEGVGQPLRDKPNGGGHGGGPGDCKECGMSSYSALRARGESKSSGAKCADRVQGDRAHEAPSAPSELELRWERLERSGQGELAGDRELVTNHDPVTYTLGGDPPASSAGAPTEVPRYIGIGK